MLKKTLHQQKARANGVTAVHTQAHLTALSSNLLTIVIATLEQAGLREEKIERENPSWHAARPKSRRVLAQEMAREAAQLTRPLIRLAVHCPTSLHSWQQALPRFERRHRVYL